MNLLAKYPLLTVFSGNSGNAGTAQQWRGLQRSHWIYRSGNVGTQIYLPIGPDPLPVPTKKTVGTKSNSETLVLERLVHWTHVPTHFAFSDTNKGVLARSA